MENYKNENIRNVAEVESATSNNKITILLVVLLIILLPISFYFGMKYSSALEEVENVAQHEDVQVEPEVSEVPQEHAVQAPIASEYPHVYTLFEDASMSGRAPMLLSHRLEILSSNRFYYSADGHMTMDRVSGDIKPLEGEYPFAFVVTDDLVGSGKFEPGFVLFASDTIEGEALDVAWFKAIPLIESSNTFTLQQ